MKLLVIEDDPVLGKALERGLSEAGHFCQWERTGKSGLEQASTQQFDALVLDVMLPDTTGMEVVRKIRHDGIGTPVLMLTALGSVDDRVAGLNSGADDYLVKPFAFPELLARLDAISRRTKDRPSSQLKVGPLVLDLTNRKVTRNDSELSLTPTEFSLLEFLMRYAGQVVTRKMLCEHLWESDWEGVTNVVEVHINRLRGKIDRGFSEPLIQTVRGRGYVLRTT
ncbi:two component transcriptional regulator, winged helix family [Pirellula staleyi DSM 6068]|uniref:Two component transcriptional regulator, winged helix family n=1 Tax=Pirellula staleyi (strain ATCC 27377 / DSM 6068 / ICPB 4128) TaxID=530564 RepID=D2QX61_PIRSD|nr:response regulator transcription factor [Pirellula staleyi]ADB17901.1 two component transcriptional regulator, winged helix family [Pirellula staleyi DSM 6068]